MGSGGLDLVQHGLVMHIVILLTLAMYKEMIDAFSVSARIVTFAFIFLWDTFLVRSSKFCMIISCVELCLFIPLLMTVTLFRGHRCISKVKLHIVFSE